MAHCDLDLNSSLILSVLNWRHTHNPNHLNMKHIVIPYVRSLPKNKAAGFTSHLFLHSLRTVIFVSSKPTGSQSIWLLKWGHLCFHNKHSYCYFYSGGFAQPRCVVLISELKLLTQPCWLDDSPVEPNDWLTAPEPNKWIQMTDDSNHYFFFFILRESEHFSGNYLVFFCPALDSKQLEPIKKSVE